VLPTGEAKVIKARAARLDRCVLASLLAIVGIWVVVHAADRNSSAMQTGAVASFAATPNADCFGLGNPWRTLPPRGATSGTVDLTVEDLDGARVVPGVAARADLSVSDVPPTIVGPGGRLRLEPAYAIFGYWVRTGATIYEALRNAPTSGWSPAMFGGCSWTTGYIDIGPLRAGTLVAVEVASNDASWTYLWRLEPSSTK
jgi:hypothetical protein